MARIWCRGLMMMIRILLLLTVLFDSSFCLSEKGRIALTKVAGPDLNSVFGGVASIEEVNRIEGIDEYLYDGDMILTEEQLSALESDIANPSRAKRQIAQYATRWTNNKVYYFFDANITVPNRQYTRTVLKYLQQRTCLSFIESTTAATRIKVFPGAGCYSYVGMLSGVQELSLASGCMVAPAGKTIQFRVTALKDVRCGNGCLYSSIEPRILLDKAMTSPRICCSEQLNTILASNHNPAPIVAYSLYLRSTFTYEYRYL
ncbi:astacin [Teladorsagia circumcincta]|uniref:Astacin n=1 Tax=Teladorsagia circumcincta TaxID=45464 RepID=A0A2G9U1Z9_TELCI|nr:astacin [Teladorsagia circumcincta]